MGSFFCGRTGYLKGCGWFQVACGYSELTKTSTALARLAVTCVLSAARRLVLIFVNPLYGELASIDACRSSSCIEK